ncbi:meiotic recombination protein spo11 [Aspergillus steynii IBT 23096]|uniref:DNA topoisomerase (ATP-hydrolyzing) n=1 Tax=Aspergillus steynii IBT 23096 TaxID=1392250 RepID=A0A2I2FR71_9EURO|nr:meiotic recombination protein spo11 [Aspergillus steynii IBT 23096]PLB43130.1 meiotic recombination protein spo11 [Aspergillus steynii IBT 23096]
MALPFQDAVQSYIATTISAVLHELSSPDGRPIISISRRPPRQSCYINPVTGALEADGSDSRVVNYSWPGRDAHEAWEFTIVFRILAVITEAIHAGLVISKRDIYYTDPACFGSQRAVDTVIDDLAHTIGVDRLSLNVEAAAKGLVTGHFRLTPQTRGASHDCASDKDALIPRIRDFDNVDTSSVKWVLIIEKEAVYRRLARNDYHIRAAAGEGILITGKGYPDLSTREFVRKLSESRQLLEDPLHFYALVDNDPDGMAIMSTYKYGSMAHTRDNARLNIPCLRWLGLRTSDVVAGASSLEDDALIPLTARDRKKIIAMLSSNPVWAADGPELGWRAELQQMLMLNVKAELEILYNRDGGIEGWVDQKMATVVR